MISISKEANPNYLAKIFKVENIRKHTNADRLQIATIDFQTVVTGLETKIGDVFVYFPLECKINKDFLGFTNSLRDKTQNRDKEKAGFFEDNCRVRAVSLRGEKSMGYIVPVSELEEFTGVSNLSTYVGQEFDTVGDIKILEKYIIKSQEKKTAADKKGSKPSFNRLVDGQVHFHVDTENFRKNAFKIQPDDLISVTYKTHGTSFWVSNVLTKRQLNWKERLAKKLGVNVEETDYDIIYGSRRVVKNSHIQDPKNKNSWYKHDVWKDIADQIGNLIPKGYTVYGECLGYTKDGSYIQADYDYGCKVGEFKLEIYRITSTNSDGVVTELTYSQIKEFCERVGLTPAYLFFSGKAKDMYPEISTSEHWHENFVKQLEQDYNEKNCFMCINNCPEEGIVIRKENLFSCESYKLKSFKFLEKESKQLDANTVDLESVN